MAVFFYVLFFFSRLVTLFVSIRNEKRLLEQGAIQYGKWNSTLLSILHFSFFIGSLIELLAVDTALDMDMLRWIGVCLYLFSHIVLWVVICQLKTIWTVKIYILKDHTINQSFLFKYFKHPNYYLSILPELIGVGILCKSWYTMSMILPVYFVVLGIRIRQEERAMAKLSFSKR